MDLDTFLTTLYVIIDDWYRKRMSRAMQRHPGPPLKMSDSEVLTLMIAAQWRVGVPWQSERGMVRYMLKHGMSWFPGMLNRSQFNLRGRQLWTAYVCMQQDLAKLLITDEVYEVVDCTPLPHCSLGQAITHDRHWLCGKKGRGGNHGGWFFGEQLLVAATDKGVITGWVMGPGNIDDRWLMQALLSGRKGFLQLNEIELPKHRQYGERRIPCRETFSPVLTVGDNRGLPYLADGGFNGQRWIDHWKDESDAIVIAPPARNSKRTERKKPEIRLRNMRQVIETVFARLVQALGLHRVNAHSGHGMLARVAAKTAAYNFAILLNRQLGRPDGKIETLIC